MFDKGKTLNLDLQEQLKESNSRRRKIILESLFSSNVIFCEGLSDEIFLDDLIFNNMSEIRDKHISIFDTNSKDEVKKCGEILHNLQLLNHINVHLFYDLDPNKKYPNGEKIVIPSLKSTFFDPDLEKTFYYEDKTTKDKFITKKGQKSKKNLSLKINDILNDSTIPKSDILQKIKYYKNEIKNWIK
ncbi:MAG: TOPRIM nucleotidyl transferase/hydrolase domain-containing protein [Metamycoplasmataceae bacterium]